MKAFLLEKDIYLIYKEDGTTQKVFKSSLEAEKESLQEAIPENILNDNVKLLEWAKINYPISSDCLAIDNMQSRINEIDNLLNLIKEV